MFSDSAFGSWWIWDISSRTRLRILGVVHPPAWEKALRAGANVAEFADRIRRLYYNASHCTRWDGGDFSGHWQS